MASVIELIFYACVAFAAFALWKLVMAWVQGGSQDVVLVDAEVGELQELAAEKARALQDIKELEFDHQIGHLSKADYESLRGSLERKTIQFMRRLDQLRGSVDYDAIIEEGLDRRLSELERGATKSEATMGSKKPGAKSKAAGGAKGKQKAPSQTTARTVRCRECGYAMAEDSVFCSECGTETEANCSKCGHPRSPGARFCAKCGTQQTEGGGTDAKRAPKRESEPDLPSPESEEGDDGPADPSTLAVETASEDAERSSDPGSLSDEGDAREDAKS
jgi:hypothetical protein